jgi:redox-sensitive bicupin YhaK (pirin superfamily)
MTMDPQQVDPVGHGWVLLHCDAPVHWPASTAPELLPPPEELLPPLLEPPPSPLAPLLPEPELLLPELPAPLEPLLLPDPPPLLELPLLPVELPAPLELLLLLPELPAPLEPLLLPELAAPLDPPAPLEPMLLSSFCPELASPVSSVVKVLPPHATASSATTATLENRKAMPPKLTRIAPLRPPLPLRARRLRLMGMTTASPASAEVRDRLAAVRSVEAVHRSTTFHWVGNGFHVSTYFPSHNLPSERVSPFVLMDYGPPKEFAPLPKGRRGVGWHPHRGFETVTLAWEGAVAHRDNAGHAGLIGPGDVQWMTAGAGIFHEEYHAEEQTRRGGRMHMMQLWVNLARKDKGAPPGYQPIGAGDIPSVPLEGGGAVRVIAGEYGGARGPAKTFSPITMLDVRLKAGARLAAALPSTYNALAVVAEGRVGAGGRSASAGELVLFANDGAAVDVVATEDAHVILLAGEPLREPIVQYGPFVMSTMQEIQQAVFDVEAGRFGPVPED